MIKTMTQTLIMERNKAVAKANISGIACRSLPAFALVAFTALGVPALAQNAMPAPPEVSFRINKFEVVGQNPLGEARVQALLAPYLGQQTGLDKLQQATQALEKLLQAEGYGLYRVVLPPQDAVDTITIRIEPVKLADIKIKGSKYRHRSNIRSSLSKVQENTSPNMRDVARQLYIANQNPSKKTGLRLSQNEIANGIDVALDVEDERPWSTLIGFNNSGTPDTGRGRAMGLFQNHNLFDRDHVLSLAYTTSPEQSRDVNQFGLFYRAPVYEYGGMVTGSYSRSSVGSGALGNGQEITGSGTTMGLHYTHFFHPEGQFRTNLSVGVDDRLFKAPAIGGVVLPTGDVRSRPVKVEYNVQYDPQWGNANWSIAYARNLPSGSMNTDAAYAANRAGADSSWAAWTLSYGAVARLGSGGWLLNANGRAQYASEPLISGEQYGLGGANSVRGLDERAVAGDSGVSLSLEVLTPEIRKGLRALGFVEGGHVRRHSPVVGTSARENLLSVGLGLRYTKEKFGSFSLDYGRIVHAGNSPGTARGTDRLHANILLQF